HRQAARFEHNHQLEDSRQWCGRLDRGHTFGHDLLHWTVHHVVVVGHHLTGREDKGPQKIEFGHDPHHLSAVHDGKELKSCLSKSAFKSRNVTLRVTVMTLRVMY